MTDSAEDRIVALEARLVAAEARLAALEAARSTQVQYTIGDESPPQSPSSQPLGKDATCSYCGGALWVCRGVHNVC